MSEFRRNSRLDGLAARLVYVVFWQRGFAADGIFGGADVLQLGQMADGCGANVIS